MIIALSGAKFRRMFMIFEKVAGILASQLGADENTIDDATLSAISVRIRWMLSRYSCALRMNSVLQSATRKHRNFVRLAISLPISKLTCNGI